MFNFLFFLILSIHYKNESHDEREYLLNLTNTILILHRSQYFHSFVLEDKERDAIATFPWEKRSLLSSLN